MRTSTLLSIAASLSSASGTVYKGFNYGSTFTDGSAKAQADFQKEFDTAKNLVGTSGFTSARLYTMIVCLPLKPALELSSLQTSGHLLTGLFYSKAAPLQIPSKPFPLRSPKTYLFFSEYGYRVDKTK
jgi:glucan endo-1,3-beta-D-glucosidase